jgi:hypothetical protein
MTRTVLAYFGVGVLIAGSWLAGSSAQENAGQRRWEYRVVGYDQVQKLSGEGKNLTIGLNKLGQDGWELAAADGLSVEAQLNETTDPNIAARLREQGPGVFIFKRPR